MLNGKLLIYNKRKKNNGCSGLSKNPNWRKAMCHNGEKENDKYAFGG